MTAEEIAGLYAPTDAELIVLYRWALGNGAAGTTRTINGRSVTFPSATEMMDIVERLEAREAASSGETGGNIAIVQWGEPR